MTFTFDIIDPATGEVVATVTVSPDDVAEWRVLGYNSWSDAEIAAEIYEQREGSALANAGLTHQDALDRRLTLRRFAL